MIRPTFLAAIALSAMSALTPTVHAQLPVVTVYENAFFGGSALPILLGPVLENVPFDLGGFNDRVTSLRWSNLPADVAVVFYENRDGSGREYRIAPNASRSGSVFNVGSTFNDTFSSVAWQVDSQASHGLVTLFDGPDAAGQDRRLPLSAFAEGQVHRLFGFEDRTSSITWVLRPDEVVTFYENADGSGREYSITHDTARVGILRLLSTRYDNEWSAFRWDRVDPAQGWFRAWTDFSLTGEQLTRYLSVTGRGAFGLPGYDDQISSVEWNLPTDSTVFLRDGGACRSLTGVGQAVSLVGIWDDSISTFEVHGGDRCADGSDRNRTYDRNTYLCAHNAHASRASGWSAAFYQDLSYSSQLEYGVRALRIQTLRESGTFYLVNGTFAATVQQRGGSTPQRLTTFETAVRTFLQSNPREVVTLIIDNQDGSPVGQELLAGSLRNFLHFQDRGSWPTLNELIARGTRCVVFEAGTRAAGSVLPRWFDHAVENQGAAFGATAPEPGSLPIDERQRGLFLVNNRSSQFPSSWPSNAGFNVFVVLRQLVDRFGQTPNFVCVDRITRAGEGAADMARTTNFQDWVLREQNGGRAEFARFGEENCGDRTLEALTRPVTGTGLDLRIDGNRGGVAGLGTLVLGLSDSTVPGVGTPLPLDLFPSLGVSCQLRVSNDISVPYGASASQPVGLSIPVPATAALQGSTLFLQAVEQSPGSLVVTNGGRARLGAR